MLFNSHQIDDPVEMPLTLIKSLDLIFVLYLSGSVCVDPSLSLLRIANMVSVTKHALRSNCFAKFSFFRCASISSTYPGHSVSPFVRP